MTVSCIRYRTTILIVVWSLFFTQSGAQSFSVSSKSDFLKITDSSIEWADLDNDGDLDIVCSGAIKPENHVTTIYKNLGNDSFRIDSSIYVTSVGWRSAPSHVSCQDFDNDGWIDVLLIGPETKLLRNLKGKGFSDKNDFTVRGNYASCGDFNNDGLMDIIISSSSATYVLDFYKNTGSFSFEHQPKMQLKGGGGGNIDWGDFDNDGFDDLLVCGQSTNGEDSRIYKNKFGREFEPLNVALEPATESASRWTDFNNDGRLDVLIAGRYRNAILQWKIYKNNGAGSFSRQVSVDGLTRSHAALGDFDKDGDVDVFLSGSPTVMNASAGYYTPTTLYYQNRSGGSYIGFGGSKKELIQVFAGELACADMDNDNDLDIVVTGSTTTYGGNTTNKPTPQFSLYKNIDTTKNQPPSAPTRLSIERENGSTYLNWKSSIDDHTNSSGITYNLMLGTDAHPESIVSGDAFVTSGIRKRVKVGNLGTDTVSEISMASLSFDSTYFARVQAIDNSFKGSEFSSRIPIPVRIQATLIDEITALCGDTVVIPLLVLNQDTAAIKYSWTPIKGLSNPSSANPFFIATESGHYKVVATAQNGEKYIDSVYVEVSGISVDVKADTSVICGSELELSTEVKSSTSDTFFTFSWKPTIGLSDSTSPNPKLHAYQSEKFSLQVRSSSGCIAKDTITVTTLPLTVELNDDSKECKQDRILQINTNAHRATMTYSWGPQKGLNDTALRNPTTSTIESMHYWVVVRDSICKARDSCFVTVIPADLEVDFMSSQTLFTASPFAFQTTNLTPNREKHDFSFLWGDDSVLVSNNEKVFHEYEYNGVYTVELIAVDTATGCADTMTKADYIYCTGGKSSITEDNTKTVEPCVYPNPSRGVIQIVNPQDRATNCRIEIYNSYGKLLYRKSIDEGSTSINLSKFAKGSYLIYLNNGDFEVTRKLVLN